MAARGLFPCPLFLSHICPLSDHIPSFDFTPQVLDQQQKRKPTRDNFTNNTTITKRLDRVLLKDGPRIVSHTHSSCTTVGPFAAYKHLSPTPALDRPCPVDCCFFRKNIPLSTLYLFCSSKYFVACINFPNPEKGVQQLPTTTLNHQQPILSSSTIEHSTATSTRVLQSFTLSSTTIREA